MNFPQRITLLSLIFLAIACSDDPSEEGIEVSIPVSTVEVKKGSIESYVLTSGSLEAQQAEKLFSQAVGRYRLAKNPKTGKPFQSGDMVKKGQTIIQLENPEFISDVRLSSRKLELDISQREYEKQKSLFDKGGVTLRELKSAEKALIDAQYSVDNANLQLSKLRIQAGFNGTLANLPFYSTGSEIPLNTELAEVVRYDRLIAEVNLPAVEINRIKAGQLVKVTQYNQPEDTLLGKIVQVAPSLNPETRSFSGLIEIENADLLFRPGMFARFNIVVEKRGNTIVIPRDIILAQQRGPTVYIVDKGAAERRVLTLGLENPLYVEVENGLNEKDRLVVKGFETLRHRSKVKVVN